MSNELQVIDSLVAEITGSTRFLSHMISRKSGLAFLLIVCIVLISKLILV